MLDCFFMLMLTKIQEARFIEDMYENEYLYFSSLKEFRSSKKDNSGRLDPRELNLKNEQLNTVTIKIKDQEIKLHEILKDFSAQYNEHLSEPRINCCSLHWLEIEAGSSPSTLNDRLIEMGDKALLIYNCAKFFEILDKSVETCGYEYSRKKVEYYNPKSYNGELTLHHKDEKYFWQNEFRILIFPVDCDAVKIPLKGLKEISLVLDSIDLEKLKIEIITDSH